VQPLHNDGLTAIANQLRQYHAVSVAIALVNSYRNPVHEQQLEAYLAHAGFPFVSTSHQLSAQIGIVARATTTVANAYLSPIIRQYVAGIQSGLSTATLKIMSSAGGLMSAVHFQPKDSLLSGPAGGVVGAARAAARSGVSRLIAFDMGGTSTDVSLYDGKFDYRYQSVVGNQSILSPSLAIETIAAGGGSICDFDGYRLTVGPQSAGANPGPACYGAGGPLTITDVNLLLGNIYATDFSIPLYPDRSEQALKELQARIALRQGGKLSRRSLLLSLLQIANEKMADAIRKVSVQRGYHPADYTLLSFGGAGGQHACSLADMLGMNSVLVPYEAGLLSAYGIGHAEEQRFEEQLILKTLQEGETDLNAHFIALEAKAKSRMQQDGFTANQLVTRHKIVFLRYAGQEAVIEVPFRQHGMNRVFRKLYARMYGSVLDRAIEIESIRVVIAAPPPSLRLQQRKTVASKPTPVAKQPMGTHGSAAVYHWEKLKAGAIIHGPALVFSSNSTTVVDSGWKFILDAAGNAMLRRTVPLSRTHAVHSDAAKLELFTNRFTAIAQEMGALLQRASFSVNVKERLDFSCALLDPAGRLVVNAPHIPVHLGSLGVCVREVVRTIRPREGDVIITNHPAFGGSHLPDVTLIKPVYHRHQLVGYVANRAHHAEIGGREPGSMPADATSLQEEGVIIEPTWLVKKGKPLWSKIRRVLLSGPYPSRSVEENLADLRGALAAIEFGDEALQSLCAQASRREVVTQMERLRQHAASMLRNQLKELPSIKRQAIERLDDGSVLKVAVQKARGRLTIDFTGTAPVHKGNLNATHAIVQSVVLYVLRLLVNQPVPMNEGMMEPVDLVLPTCMLNPDFQAPERMPAVVGGNTEVSQRLTDTLLKALGLAACSQGTMNNFLFGNEHFGYYETICGGTGAGPGFDGTDAVHQHMTNTRITDPEVLEYRYPVRLGRFEIRRGSGGKGKWTGGDGVVREICFLAPLRVNILSQHRVQPPYGMKGGQPGKVGRQLIERKGGSTQVLHGMDQLIVYPDDVITIETPGGGGWGRA